MNKEDIDFLISIQDLEQPDFDNDCLEKENERLNKEIQRLIKELKLKTNFIQYLTEIIYKSNDNELHTEAYLYGKEYLNKLKELKEGK